MTKPHDGTAWREGGGVIAWPEGNRVIGHLYFIFYCIFFLYNFAEPPKTSKKMSAN